jgi:DNA-binding MarR family transcriptional regulator
MTPRRAESFRNSDRAAETPVEDSIARVIASWREAKPELHVEPIAITARLARLQAVLGPQLEAIFAHYGLRGPDFAVLATLVRLGTDKVSQRRLAAELGLSAGTVSLRLDRLAHLGLAQRRADPEDGRGALIALTDRGRQLFETCAPEHLANAEELLAGMSNGDRERLGQLLGKLLQTLEEAGPDDRIPAAMPSRNRPGREPGAEC